MNTFSACSVLSVAPEEFWRRMSLASVNSELAPFVRMTAPGEWKARPLAAWPTGQSLFRSIILLFSFMPVDVHSLRLQSVDPDRGFRERSSSWLNEVWHHERTTRACQGGCVVLDSITVQTRIHVLHWLLVPIYRAVFRHRHRRLRAIYGSADAGDSSLTGGEGG